MYEYEYYSEPYLSEPEAYINEILDGTGMGIMNSSDENIYKISDWLIAFRKAGYDSEHAVSFTNYELNEHDRFYLSQNLDLLNTKPVQIIMDGDENYSQNLTNFLKRKRPRVLFCMGNVSILNQRSIFLCGSREASDYGIELAYKCGRLAAEAGYVVLSGYARGVDVAAHLGALEAGGSTVSVLPYGLSRFCMRRELRDVFDPDCFLVVSEMPPSCGFTVKAAFRRNKILVALANAVIVIEPGESGGTWHSAQKASSFHKPLFFHEGSRPEIINRMEAMGGKHLEVTNGAPQLGEVYAAVI